MYQINRGGADGCVVRLPFIIIKYAPNCFNICERDSVRKTRNNVLVIYLWSNVHVVWAIWDVMMLRTIDARNLRAIWRKYHICVIIY